jgi:hypothetical protein
MLSKDVHISEQELLQAADGELPDRRANQVRAHLASCWSCRARMADIEGAIADFVRDYRQTLDSRLPSADGPRALLRAQLAELAYQSEAHSLSWVRRFVSAPRIATASVAALTAALVCGVLILHTTAHSGSTSVAVFERGALPEHNLTPGATRGVTISDVCSMPHEEVVREVSPSMREEVLKRYGIISARANDYEIDFLIAPGLGGAEDIHNLWPEAYNSQTWNAAVKDALEERLHRLVCSGNLDLRTAQRDIATDWIAAYKKYFHSDSPILRYSNPGVTASLVPGDPPRAELNAETGLLSPLIRIAVWQFPGIGDRTSLHVGRYMASARLRS